MVSERLKTFPEQVEYVLSRLREAGFAAYAVGGCVRDRLRGVEPKDYDVATAAVPERVEAIFTDTRVIPTGAKHGTVTVFCTGLPVEVTTFRVDGTYSDGRRPDAVAFTPSLTEDLARRDFTINAMACGADGVLVDPFGGRADLEAGVIRCVGDPDTRFREDALRILRALRFSSVLGFHIEAETAAALRRCKALLEKVSAERVAGELQKLLCGGDVRRVLTEYADVLGVALPELSFTAAAAVERTPPEPVLRWAALFHGSGKPFLLDAALRRLRLDNATRERIVLLAEWHDRLIEPSERAVKRALRRLGPEAFAQLIALKRADDPACDGLERLAVEILEKGACFSLEDLAVRGGDLIAAGMAPGPALGEALDTLLNAVIDGALPNERDALMAYLKKEGRF